MRPRVGDRVRALYPNASWGEGVVVLIREDDPILKPVTVRQEYGRLGFFGFDQVKVLGPAAVNVHLADGEFTATMHLLCARVAHSFHGFEGESWSRAEVGPDDPCDGCERPLIHPAA